MTIITTYYQTMLQECGHFVVKKLNQPCNCVILTFCHRKLGFAVVRRLTFAACSHFVPDNYSLTK